jgi:hypothetical protein
MKRPVSMLACVVASGFWATGGMADGGTSEYFVALRIPQTDQAPRYVSASQTPSDGQTSPFTACDGNTYYLTAADATAVSSAIGSEGTVQFQFAPQGAPPENSTVICLIQASP